MSTGNTHATSEAIEIFSADCPLCQDAVEVIKETVAPCGCTVRERPWEEGPRRTALSEGGAYPIPSIVVGGTVVFDGCPDSADVQWLRRSFRRDESVARGRSLTFTFDGHELHAYEGETVAAALMASGVRSLRRTSRRGEPRAAFCNMGVCFDCLMQIDGRPNVQACLMPVAAGMRVESQQGEGTWAATTPRGAE